jgi:membrane-bound metal-dependent hydrolase YbcI (DUF457 family)
LGNFHQHLKCSTSFGVTYAMSTWLLIGIDWLYGSVALLLSMLGGMLPDLDSDSGKEIKHIKSISAVLGALVFWVASGRVQPPMAFELRIWITLISAAFCSNGIRWIIARLSVHRGMFHSIPTCAIWGSVVYLYYPHSNHYVRVYMAVGIMVGYFSHLCCDEYFSIENLAAMRVNKAFGTAMKFWSGKLFGTLICYALLGFFVKQVGDSWPRTADGNLAGIGRPSESVDRYSVRLRAKAKRAAETVKKRGVVEFLKEVVAETKNIAGSKWNDVRENALSEEKLRTRFTQLKEASKSLAETEAAYGTLKQLATEAKSTVADQVVVDKAASANRPLVSDRTTRTALTVPNASGRNASPVKESASENRKKPVMEVYVPRKRQRAGNAAPAESPRVIARQGDSGAGPQQPADRTRLRVGPR